MGIRRLIFREAAFRKLNFLLGVLGVAVAIAALTAEVVWLRKYDLHTEQIIAAREADTRGRMAELDAQTRDQMARLEEDYRKIGVQMGFNVLILPRDQNLGDLYAADYAAKSMPQEYADKLAAANVATINHVLPSLQEKVLWPERQRTIILMGVSGEVYVQSPTQKPILTAVPPGKIVLGYELHQSLGLKAGDALTLMGRQFTVSRLNPARGNKDDITAWIALAQVQELLGKKGLINGILALECNCSPDRMAKIRAEIGRILPDTQVVEFATQALARAEARNRAAAEADESSRRAQAAAEASIAQEVQARAQLRQGRELFAALLVPLALLGAGVWVALLALANVRERRGEIGILRALGTSTRQVLGVFLGRALLVGVAGGVLGLVSGVTMGLLLGEPLTGAGAALPRLIFSPLLVGAALGAPLLSCLAGWAPALLAAKQDPAAILLEE